MANSNLLTGIDDAVTGATICAYTDDLDDQGVNNYTYDALGSMTVDASERITDIEWNPYGKVKAVRKDQANNTNSCNSTEYGDSDVEFLYTAGQQRLCKIIKPHKLAGAGITDQNEWIYYWYAYDAGGNLMGVYKQSFEDHTLTTGNYKVKVDLEENGVYGSGRIGIRHADDESDYSQEFTSTIVSGEFATAFTYGTTTPQYVKTHYNRTIGCKQYEIANHLGNVLVTVSDKRLLYTATPSTATEIDWYTADVISYSDYYAFGAMQTGRAGGSYRYGFNGMEKSPEEFEGAYSADYREYDSRLGRWLSQDPIVKPWESPYASFANNPIYFVDPSGLDPGTGDDPAYKGSYTGVPQTTDGFKNGDYLDVTTQNDDGSARTARYQVLTGDDGNLFFMGSEMSGRTAEVVITDSKIGGNNYSWSPTNNSNSSNGGLATTTTYADAHSITLSDFVSSPVESSDYDNWGANVGVAADMTGMWAFGAPHPYGQLYSDDPVANSLRNSAGVCGARDLFYTNYRGATDLTGASVTDYGSSFGVSRFMLAGLDPIEQFIGSYDVQIHVVNDQLIYTITNVTSFESFLYGVGPSWEGGPGGNYTQTYQFSEPIQYNLLR